MPKITDGFDVSEPMGSLSPVPVLPVLAFVNAGKEWKLCVCQLENKLIAVHIHISKSSSALDSWNSPKELTLTINQLLDIFPVDKTFIKGLWIK